MPQPTYNPGSPGGSQFPEDAAYVDAAYPGETIISKAAWSAAIAWISAAFASFTAGDNFAMAIIQFTDCGDGTLEHDANNSRLNSIALSAPDLALVKARDYSASNLSLLASCLESDDALNLTVQRSPAGWNDPTVAIVP